MKNFLALLIQFFWSFSQYSCLASFFFFFLASRYHISLLGCLYLSYPTFLLPSWQVIFALNMLVALLCLSADSFRELLAFLFSLFLWSFYLSHFMWIADEIFSHLNVCRAGPRYGCIMLRKHSLKKGILFVIYLLPLLNKYHIFFNCF